MRKWLYYLPSVLAIIVILMLEEGWLKWLLLGVLVIGIVVAKYKRSNQQTDEVEYDERVNTNIRYWSYGFISIANALLIVYLLLVSRSIISEWLTIEHMMLYLTSCLFISFYILPSIAKRL